jgi:hypothetical protein
VTQLAKIWIEAGSVADVEDHHDNGGDVRA